MCCIFGNLSYGLATLVPEQLGGLCKCVEQSQCSSFHVNVVHVETMAAAKKSYSQTHNFRMTFIVVAIISSMCGFNHR